MITQDPQHSTAHTARQMALSFVRLSIDDLERVARLEANAHSHPWSKAQVLSALQHYHCWGVRSGADWAGFAVLSCVVGEAELLDFVVAPEFQGQGVGSTLLAWLQNWAATELQAKRFYLEVRESNQAALALYQNAGFVEVGIRAGYYPARGGREDAVLMAMELIA
ncbi:ribosomal protein S18-alanine N-acetyltransferase [Pseudomaricurvus alcaniphilus]|uniref:ribosomal protein S18-alanine N-acetyltransferase n=1 Tax=Pseudomaricurvus alcaniphilus TaxID=1166482 RepID=UPI001407A0DD|nr:ribosomal protein S18-alanine N-acetyltransferase [Pseudomaricurvus alcaniphilus]NHN37992.1 ribosomal protein S18-alanine N-acetyltransferase [Pseudomaricurvus alcaniphilus]